MSDGWRKVDLNSFKETVTCDVPEDETQGKLESLPPPADDFEVDFNEVGFDDFDPAKSDKFQIAFSAHMIQLGDEARAYARALTDCGIVPPSPSELKPLGKAFVKNRQVQDRMSTLRTRLADSYLDRLEEHIDQLAELRDMAKAEGKYAPAVSAEIARGKVQGFYEPKGSQEDPNDVKVIDNDDLKRRVAEAMERMARKQVSSAREVADFAMEEAHRED